MKKLGWVSKDSFAIGDPVRVQDMKTKHWIIRGIIDQERRAQEDLMISYTVKSEDRGMYLRNGKFLWKLRSKIRLGGGKRVNFDLSL